jgi:hypothetical protein
MGLRANITGVVIDATFINEGHTVTFQREGLKMSISESMRGDSWRTLGRNWSTIRTVSVDEAIAEQDQLIKFGYTRYS